MASTTLRPVGDLTPLQWASTGASHYTEIDDDPDAPVTADYISETVNAEVDAIALTDAPADYGSGNTLTLKVYGRASADVGYTVELRKADETVLGSVAFIKNVDTVDVLKTSAPIDASALTKADIDGLKLRFIASTA